MKPILKSITTIPLLISLSTLSQAQSSAADVTPNEQKAATTTKPAIEFRGKTFTFGGAITGKIATTNDYYLPNQKSTRFSHRLTIHSYPGMKDGVARAKKAAAYFNKNGSPTLLAENPPTGTAGMLKEKALKNGVQYTISLYSDAADGKSMLIKELTVRATKEKSEQAKAHLKSDFSNILKQLAAATFPKIIIEKKSDPQKKKALPPLQKLELNNEAVTDITGKGKKWLIDDAFILKNGGKPMQPNHTPFTVNILNAEEGKILFQTRPDVPELIRFTLATEDKKLRESIRFTTLTIGKESPMELRLQKAVQLIEQGLAPRFFNDNDSGGIQKKYQTKIGPYHGAAMLGKLTTKSGNTLFIKFVAILPEDQATGLVAVMLLDPKHYEAKALTKSLSDGYMQRVLHSVRFNHKK